MTNAFAPLQFLPAQIHVFDSLPSTNDYLKSICSTTENTPEGTVIWALEQTSGRGQHHNKWVSEAGKNLTLSVLLKPASLKAMEAFRLSKTIAVAVLDTVHHFTQKKVSIKWPNDIYVDQTKIAGILIENSIQGELVKQSIIGIGLNVNQESFLSDNHPTSILKCSGQQFPLQEVSNHLLANISKRYLELQLGNFKTVDSNYFQHLYKVHETQVFFIDGKQETCTIKAIHADGTIELIVNNQIKTYLHGEALWKI